MNTALWILQSLMALVFLYSGVNKSIFSAQKLVAIGQTGVEGLPIPLIRFIGISEILGAFGLILPWWIKIFPFLTPFSALCMAAIMVPAARIHYNRIDNNNKKECINVWQNCILFAICIFIFYGRLWLNH